MGKVKMSAEEKAAKEYEKAFDDAIRINAQRDWEKTYKKQFAVSQVEPEFKQCPACFGKIPYKAVACMHCGYSPSKNRALGAIGMWLFFH